jgi:hypothetical protein
MMWRSAQPHSFEGQVIGDGHCVALVRHASGIGHTSTWRRGPKPGAADRTLGRVIATFDPDGRYGNHVDGRSHAALLIGLAAHGGLLVVDQWRGHPAQQRTIRAKGGMGLAVDDADRYYVVVTGETDAALQDTV